MQTIFVRVLVRLWKEKVMLISFFLFVGCTQQDEGLMSENYNSSTAQETDENARLSNSGTSAENKRVFTAHLSGVNEVPPTITNGQGQIIFTMNGDGTGLKYKLNVANTKNITQAHIHCGDSGVNGPVVVFLYGFDSVGVNKSGVLAEGTIFPEDIIARDSSAACMGGLNSFEALLEKMRNGNTYVNVHTVTYPGGEIRGQIR